MFGGVKEHVAQCNSAARWRVFNGFSDDTALWLGGIRFFGAFRYTRQLLVGQFLFGFDPFVGFSVNNKITEYCQTHSLRRQPILDCSD